MFIKTYMDSPLGPLPLLGLRNMSFSGRVHSQQTLLPEWDSQVVYVISPETLYTLKYGLFFYFIAPATLGTKYCTIFIRPF